jgi:hypothetical protein
MTAQGNSVPDFDGEAIARAEREFLASLADHPFKRHPLFGAPRPPQPDFGELSTDKDERAEQLEDQKEARAAVFDQVAAWMVVNYAYHKGAFAGKGGIISLAQGGPPLTDRNLTGLYKPYALVTVGDRGAVHYLNPFAIWMAHPRRQEIDDIQCRSDKPRPLYTEDGATIYNSYKPPVHPSEGGDIAAFETFFARLIPDAAEREWLWNYYSYKARHPWTPMVGLIIVATEYGTGRGTLFEILALLFGKNYVVPCSFDDLTKTSGGARFNSRHADALIIVVHEAVSEDGVQQNQKRLQYEQLKLVMDPSPTQPKKVEAKWGHAGSQVPAATINIATQHVDIVKLPPLDRRVCVVTGGRRMTVPEIKWIRAWMADPANIGALHRALLMRPAVPEAVFDPFGEPPAFAGRLEMIGASETRLEDAYGTAIGALKGCTLFTLTQMLTLIADFGNYSSGSSDWSDKARFMVTKHAYRLRKRDEPHNRVVYQGRREIVYARTAELQQKWREADDRLIAEQLNRTSKVIESILNSATGRLGEAMRKYHAGKSAKKDKDAAAEAPGKDDEE